MFVGVLADVNIFKIIIKLKITIYALYKWYFFLTVWRVKLYCGRYIQADNEKGRVQRGHIDAYCGANMRGHLPYMDRYSLASIRLKISLVLALKRLRKNTDF